MKITPNNTLPHPLLWLILVPLTLGLVQIALYFSGNEICQFIVAPDMPGRKSDREFGLLENIQNVLLLGSAVVCWLGGRRASLRREAWLYRLAALGFILMTLEEMDYGLHFYEHARDIHVDSSAEFRNLHNQGETTYYLRKVIDIGSVVFFILLPLYHRFRPIRQTFLARFVPSLWYIPAIILSRLVSDVAHFLQDRIPPPVDTLEGNISEFREMIFYTILLVYLVEVLLFRPRGKGKSEATETEASGSSPRSLAEES